MAWRFRRGSQGRWQALAAGLMAAATCGPCWGQLERHETDRLFASIENTQRRIAAADWAGCLEALDHTADLAQRDWTQTSLNWFGVRLRCEARLMLGRGQPVTADTLEQLMAPGLRHVERVPPGVERRTGARMLLQHSKWWLMRDLGLGDAADRDEHQDVESLMEADRRGHDPRVREDLDRWAHARYGHHQLRPQTEGHLRWIEGRWGQGHRAALILRRAIAFAYRSADRNADALAVMDEAARLAALHHAGDADLRMLIAGERAPCLAANGLLLEARDEFIALRDGMLARVPVPHGNLMRMNYHLAGIANELGDHEQAEAFADAADRHARASPLPNDRIEVAVAHLQRAEARLMRGVPGAVAEVQAEIERIGPGDGGTGAPAFSLAKLARRSGDAALLAWAMDFLERHAQQRLQPLQPARALVEITAAWSVADREPDRTRALLERAATRGLSDRDPGVSVQSAFSMAGQLAAAQPEAALWWFKRGANALQAMRQRGRAAQDEGMHRATLADHEADLRSFIALLIDQGRWLEARDALRVLREEELHDFTRRSRRRAAAARSGSLAFTPQERRFEAALEPLAERMRVEQPLADARARPVPLEQPGAGWLDDPASEEAVGAVQAELRALLARIEPSAKLPSAGGVLPCARAVPGARDLGCTAQRAGREMAPSDRVPPGTARMQVFVRDAHLDILVTTARGWHRHSVPMARTELNRRVHAWRAALLNPESDARPGAREFHDLLIQPLNRHLRGVHRLQVSLDGALRYLPLAALHDGQRYLVQRFTVVMDDGIEAAADSASKGTAAPRGGAVPATLRLAAFGRTAPDADHSALPGVEAELKTLAELGRPWHAAALADRVLKDGAFTAQALHDTLAATPSVVHIASHFHLAAAEEESSYLLLGDGQRLPLARLAQMPWSRVQLVLLSACDSAFGDASRQGREFNGLAGVLRQAGVGQVLASLWPIADRSTAEFMREFYRPMAADARTAGGRAVRQLGGTAARLPDATWLTQAQRRWLARHAGGAHAHPYRWAAFAWWGGGPMAAPQRGPTRRLPV